jgi:hypothetical protein
MAARRSIRAEAETLRTVKVSVPLGVRDHARLCGVAALRGMTVSAFAAEAIREALRGVTLIDRHGKGESADCGDSSCQDIKSAPGTANSTEGGEIAA